MTNPSELRFNNIVKIFGGTKALKGVSMSVKEGEIVALLGENGAGKSTLIKVFGGIHSMDSGSITIDGQPYHHKASRFGERQKVAFIHQDLGLVEWMTVAENMALALGFARNSGLISWKTVEQTAIDALAKVHCDVEPTARVNTLSRTEKSLIAIARALAVDCTFLVLDEPTASLPADEVGNLLEALRRLRKQGVGMIYVSHRLSEVFEIADQVVVLRDGAVVKDCPIAEINSAQLVEAIVGGMAKTTTKPTVAATNVVARLRDVETATAGPVSFDLREGEILGLVGLRGAGHENIARAIFGIEQRFGGSIQIDGKEPNLSSPQKAMEAGIGLIARDRVEESVAPGLSIRENFFMNPPAVGRGRWAPMTRQTEAVWAEKIGNRVALYPNDPELSIESLSGGNQQKVVAGRWLESGRRLLICEDPTAGVDIGAKGEIYTLLNETAAKGVGILVVSTDFEEVTTICNRALVFAQGRITEEIKDADISVESLITAASAKAPEQSKRKF